MFSSFPIISQDNTGVIWSFGSRYQMLWSHLPHVCITRSLRKTCQRPRWNTCCQLLTFAVVTTARYYHMSWSRVCSRMLSEYWEWTLTVRYSNCQKVCDNKDFDLRWQTWLFCRPIIYWYSSCWLSFLWHAWKRWNHSLESMNQWLRFNCLLLANRTTIFIL